jgi:autotransporter-associated beta strand protein
MAADRRAERKQHMKAGQLAVWKRCAGVGLAVGLCLSVAPRAAGEGEANLTTSNYFQDFNSMGTNAVASLPSGFKMTPSNILSTQQAVWTNTANFVVTALAADGGAPTDGGRYNWGAAGGTDRAPGFMTGTTATRFLGNNGIIAGFTNNTGHTITQIVAGFVWEQYRINTEAATNLCYFSLDGKAANWQKPPLYSNVFPAAADAYGYPLSTTAVSVTKEGQAITNGGKFYFLFYFTQQGNTKDKSEGWAVDDLALTLDLVPLPQCTPGEVAFVQQPWNYTAFEDGGGLFQNGPDELGMSANGSDQRVAAWRNFLTGGDGDGDARKLQPGDRFRITVSGDATHGTLGCALNDGAAMNSWADRTNHARGYIECSHGGDLAVVSSAGATPWPGANPVNSPATLEFHVLSSREFTANIVGQAPKCDLAMLNNPGDNDRIDGFSIYCENDGDDEGSVNSTWKQETTVTNLGFVELGADGGTRTIAGKITDGSSPACPNTPSPNRVIKTGAGTVTLGNTNNTYTLDTEISGGTLRIAADGCLGAAPAAVSNAHIKLAGGSALAFMESFTLNASRGLAIGAGTGGLVVAEARTVIYAGAIGGPGSLAKDGVGTLVLSGHDPFANATTVAVGTLVVSGSLSNSAVTVSSGATLAGAGTVGDLAVSGTVDPGDSPGTQSTLKCGLLSLNADGTMRVDISNATGTPGTDWDLLSAEGAIHANAGGIFTIRLCGSPIGFNPAQDYHWQIMGGTSVVDFSPSRFTVNTNEFLVALDGGSFSVGQNGADLVLDYAPGTSSNSAFNAWLQQRGLDPEDGRYAPDADDDLDGKTTWEEFAADTDPAWSGSVLRVTGTYDFVGRQLLLEFPASSNRFYQLVYATNLAQGYASSNLGPGIPGMVITNAGSGTWFGGIRANCTNPVPP